MLIRFTKLTNETHRFEIVRDDGSCEMRELETRSALIHDLVHYAVESEAGLQSSFYGRLAAGESYDALTEDNAMARGESIVTERIVVLIQGAVKRPDWLELDTEAFVAELFDRMSVNAVTFPAWYNAGFVSRVRERLRRVMGQWRATPFHQAMELTFVPRG